MALERANYEPESICFADRIYPLQLGLYPGGQHRPQFVQRDLRLQRGMQGPYPRSPVGKIGLEGLSSNQRGC